MREALEECHPLAMTACTRNRPRWHASPRSQADVTETFSLALTCRFASIFPRVFKHAVCSKFPLFFLVVRGLYRETGSVVFSHCSMMLSRCPRPSSHRPAEAQTCAQGKQAKRRSLRDQPHHRCSSPPFCSGGTASRNQAVTPAQRNLTRPCRVAPTPPPKSEEMMAVVSSRESNF